MCYRINNYQSVTAVIVLLLVSLACGITRTEELKEAVRPTIAKTEVELEEIEFEVTETVGEEDEPVEVIPTNTPRPTALPPTPTPEPESIIITKSGFGQNEQLVGYAFIVENPNMGLSYEDSQYQLAAFNENGVVVATDSGYIDILLPGQILGIGGELYLDEGIIIDRIDVQVNAGDAEVTEPIPSFTVDSVSYYPDEYFPFVSGVVINPYSVNLTDLQLSAVVYDEVGNIIGGGYGWLNFILANSSSGAQVTVTSAGNVGSFELYPVVSGFSSQFTDEDIPAGVSNIKILKSGFGQDEFSAGYGILVENPNQGFSLEYTQYQVTAYSDDGRVLTTDDGVVNLILPGQIIGIGGDLYLQEGMIIDYLDAQIIAGDFIESEEFPYFTSENAVYQAGSYSSKVTGIILSPYHSDITDVRVSAVTYDGNGAVNGGGYTYLDFVPANGQAAVEVLVAVSGTPVKVELFATLSSLSEIE
jgi:hypothetical protein